jgi:Electron transfer DM13
MRRFIVRWWWVAALAAVVGLPVAWYLASPLFIDRIVAEEFHSGGAELARGAFTDADSFHKGAGTARLVSIPAGAEVRFESFEVTNGPDLYVYLALHPEPRSRDQVDQGFVNLGRLKGNVGPQAYPIPAGTEPARYRSVVIYCRAFHVVFSTATLAAP